MPAPTLISDTETVWNTVTKPKTVSMTTDADDHVVVLFGCEESMDTTATSMNASGTLTWTEYEDRGAGSRGRVGIWAAPGVVASGWTLSGTTEASGSTRWWGFNAVRFSGASGIGAAESIDQAAVNATIGITTTEDNSAIAVICVDWTALDYPSRNWNSASAGNGTELSYFRDGSHYTVFVGYYPDAGAAGAKTVGCLVGSTQGGHSIAAIEIIGGAGPPPDPPPSGDRSGLLQGLPYVLGSQAESEPPAGFDPRYSSMLLTFL